MPTKEEREKEQEQDQTRSSNEGKEFDRPIPKNIEKNEIKKPKE